MQTDLTRRLGLTGPLFLAPMAGASTPELAAEVSNAGGLGSIGGAYLSPDELQRQIRQVKVLTRGPFAVNLFAPAEDPKLSPRQIDGALKATEHYRREVKVSDPIVHPPYSKNFEQQLAVVLEERPAVFSFALGMVDRRALEECKGRGIFTLGAATCLAEGTALEEAGVDAVVGQGLEAGGHRAIFSPSDDDPMIGTMTLTQILAENLHVPVVAAGGIMSGRAMAAALALGAQAAQLGTAFLACDEAGISAPYRKALLAAAGKNTRLTRAFTGRLARAIENRIVVEMGAPGFPVLPFPAQSALMREMRWRAEEAGRADLIPLWAGQGVGLIRVMPAGALVKKLMEEMEEAASRLASRA